MYEHLALSDNGFLFDTRTGNTFSVSRSGTFLLRALIAGAKADALADRLVTHFETDSATAVRDVEQFMFRLRDMGLAPSAEDLDEQEGR